MKENSSYLSGIFNITTIQKIKEFVSSSFREHFFKIAIVAATLGSIACIVKIAKVLSGKKDKKDEVEKEDKGNKQPLNSNKLNPKPISEPKPIPVGLNIKLGTEDTHSHEETDENIDEKLVKLQAENEELEEAIVTIRNRTRERDEDIARLRSEKKDFAEVDENIARLRSENEAIRAKIAEANKVAEKKEEDQKKAFAELHDDLDVLDNNMESTVGKFNTVEEEVRKNILKMEAEIEAELQDKIKADKIELQNYVDTSDKEVDDIIGESKRKLEESERTINPKLTKSSESKTDTVDEASDEEGDEESKRIAKIAKEEEKARIAAEEKERGYAYAEAAKNNIPVEDVIRFEYVKYQELCNSIAKTSLMLTDCLAGKKGDIFGEVFFVSVEDFAFYAKGLIVSGLVKHKYNKEPFINLEYVHKTSKAIASLKDKGIGCPAPRELGESLIVTKEDLVDFTISETSRIYGDNGVASCIGKTRFETFERRIGESKKAFVNGREGIDTSLFEYTVIVETDFKVYVAYERDSVASQHAKIKNELLPHYYTTK